MDYPNVDLNALAAFAAIRRTGSVTEAAIELNLAQSTLSNRLRRMRTQLGDPLFVKTADGMIPTPFAAEFGSRVVDALALIDGGLKNKDKFDPSEESRRFTIIMTNITELLLVPALLERCRTEAPGMSFATKSLTDHETEIALKAGDADIAIGFFPEISTGLMQRHVMDSEYACIAAKNHPTIGDTISREAFLSARYAIAEARGTGHQVIERALQREGVAHRIGARLSGFLPLSMIVAASDMVATVPKPLADMVRDAAKIKVLPHPLELPRLHIKQFWHERFHQDPGNVWLRGSLGELYRSIDAMHGS